ncbi:MAG: hypothetical protein ACI865_002967 [Flavobacteriaceae bacterium]|jgi:hypothetical protein
MSELDDLLDPGVTENSNTGYAQQVPIPNAVGVLVLGIISIVGCILYGVPGLICGIISLSLHRKVKEIYLSNPAKYESSYKNAKAGQICAIIGTSLSALYLLIVIVAVLIAASGGRF